MKKIFSLLVFGGLFFVTSEAFSQNTMNITNKTDKDIDLIFVDGWEGEGPGGDLLGAGSGDILSPGESVSINFPGCEGSDASTEYEVKIVFQDGSELVFMDAICDGDFSWNIVNK